MFIELMPLIEKRAITITVAALGDGRIRVNVVLMALAGDTKVNVKVGYANKDKIAQVPESAIHALTTPLSLTGEPAEIDAQMAEQLKACVDCHGRLQQSVERAKQEIADAVKAIEERDKSRTKGKSASGVCEFRQIRSIRRRVATPVSPKKDLSVSVLLCVIELPLPVPSSDG
jgi:PRTRC genetic system protein E